MVAQRFLAPFVGVRVPTGQRLTNMFRPDWADRKMAELARCLPPPFRRFLRPDFAAQSAAKDGPANLPACRLFWASRKNPQQPAYPAILALIFPSIVRYGKRATGNKARYAGRASGR